jgi:zinc protease
MKNKGWKLSILILLILLAVWAWNKHYAKIDSEAILAHSVLKDKKFTSKVQEIKADNLSAYFLEEHSNPIISVSFLFRNAGSAYEPEEKMGLIAILENMLTNGTEKYDAISFKDISEEYGIHIGFSASDDNFSGSLQMPSEYKDKAVELFTQVLYSPRFEAKYMDLTKAQLQHIIKRGKEKISVVLENAFAETIFGDHPYGRPYIGTLETVEAVSAEDLREFMHDYFTSSNIIIGIAGDLTADEAQDLIKQMFGGLASEFNAKPLEKVELHTSGAQHNVSQTFAQAMTHFVTVGTTRKSEDFYPLYLANYIFGGSGLNSRISQVVREENGLTYGIYTTLSLKDAVQTLGGGYSATAENFGKARELLLSEWQKMADKGVTAQELQQAKQALISSHNLRFASIGGISDMLLAMQEYDLGLDFLDKRNDYIRDVTLQQVNAAARKYFKNVPDFVNVGVQETSEKEKD